MRRSAAFLLLILTGCATQRLLPDPTVDRRVHQAPGAAVNIIGEWTAVAIDGAALDEGDRFLLSITATELEVRACNTMGGGYRLNGPRLVWSGPWRSTEMACVDAVGERDVMATEGRAFAILSNQQLTVRTPAPDTLRLQGASGTIDFVRRR